MSNKLKHENNVEFGAGLINPELIGSITSNDIDAKFGIVDNNNSKKDSVDAGAHYRFQYKVKLTSCDITRGFVIVKLDPFRLSKIYKISCFALQTILKKCLCTGNRGYKDEVQDLDDIINAAQRKKEMLMEDKANE